MDYKEEQKMYREMSKPKLLDPAKYTEHDKKVVAEMTVFYSRKARRKRKPSDPTHTKKKASKRK